MQRSPPTAAPPTHRIFACERCFRRKQRCDRALPCCTQCHESGSICKESEGEARTVQVGGPGSYITRKGYVTTLLERLEALEKEAASRGLTIDYEANEPVTEPEHVDDQTWTSTQRPLSGSTPRSAEMRWPLGGPGVDMDTLSLSAMAEPRSRAEEFLKQLSMPRIIAGVTETYGGNPEVTSRVDSLWDGISQYIRHPTGQTRRLHVPLEEATKALETYMEVVDFRFPRLPVSKVRSGIEAIAAADDGPYQERLSSDPAHIFMAYMVIAIVPLVSDSYPISQGSFVSIHVLAKCLKVLDRVFNQEDGVDIIQCLHLLVVFSIHCSAAGSAWHLIGFAMNKCIALGYHREHVRLVPGQQDEEAQQQRRWAFWGCYLLDHLICAALGRPFSIHNRDVSVSLPDEANGISGSLSPIESCHAHLFRYAVLLADLTDEQSQETFDDQLGHLLSWRACAPGNNNSSVTRACLYQTSLYHTLMLRIAVRQILSAYRWDGPDSAESGRCYLVVESGISVNSTEALGLERNRVKDLRLLSICQAVSLSMGRPGMIGRNFLSLITGYSAFLMALGVLYYQGTRFMDSSDTKHCTS
ncbi:STB5 [Fusarium albosuccineum]|uniref:STB5 n=1 Tax=Fusarium albosuccineum TaxID=1237068 RepID=A0A8H4LCS1_9HYPO|nr:STB5 [Fusarium albosuccineum]